MNSNYKYIAFISYKREDEKWAKWLQHKLEYYRIPTAVRKDNPNLPERVRPIFKDTTDLSGGVLEKAINDGLEQSKYLIVICSPRAAKSPWVCKEVQRFINLGREEYIIPFIVDGMPFSDDASECFPAALKLLSGERELLGININENGQDAAAVKVVARMLGVGFDILWQRFRREKRRIRGIIAAVTMIFMIFLLSMIGYIQKSNYTVLENNSRALAAKALELTDEGDSYAACLLALSAFGDADTPRPYTPEAEGALRAASAKYEGRLLGHSDKLFHACFSSGGERVITVARDCSVRTWDIKNGVEINKKIIGEGLGWLGARLSHDGKTLASITAGNEIQVWDIESGEQIGEPLTKSQRMIEALSFSHDDKFIAAADAITFGIYDLNIVRVWNLERHQQIGLPCLGHTASITSTSFYPNDAPIIASSSLDSTIRIWNYESGRQIGEPFVGHTDWVMSASFNHDGSLIVSASADKTVRIWDTDTHQQVGLPFVGHLDIVDFASFSHDGRYIVSASRDNTVRLWDVETHQQVGKTLAGHTNFVRTVAFSPDDSHMISASDDNTAHIWEVKPQVSSIIPLRKTYEYDVESASFSIEGRHIVTESGSGVNLWDAKTGKLIKKLTDDDKLASLCSFNHQIITESDSIARIWDVETGELLSSIHEADDIGYVSCSIDSKFLAITIAFHGAHLWNVETGELVRTFLSEDNEDILFAIISPNKKYVATSSEYGLRIWNAETGKHLWKQFDIDAKFASFSSDSKLLAAVDNNKIFIWDVKTGRQIGIPLLGHIERVYYLSFNPTNRQIVSASYDNTLRIWDVETGRQIRKISLDGKTPFTFFAAFSPDGNSIVSMHGDSIYIWDHSPLQQLIDETRERFKDRELTPEERRMYYLE